MRQIHQGPCHDKGTPAVVRELLRPVQPETTLTQADLIRNLRDEVGLTQVAFGREVGLSQETVSHVESGRLSLGTNALQRISDRFGLGQERCDELLNAPRAHIEPTEIGRNLRAAREKAGMSRAKLAEKAEISEAMIGLIEKGVIKGSRQILTRLADALGQEGNDRDGIIGDSKPRPVPANDLGRMLRRRREAIGLSQVQLSKRTGWSQNHISAVELGRYSISYRDLERLLDGLEIQPFDELRTELLSYVERPLLSEAGRILSDAIYRAGKTPIGLSTELGKNRTYIASYIKGICSITLELIETIGRHIELTGEERSILLANAKAEQVSIAANVDSGEKFRELREGRGLSQTKLAKESGVDNSLVSHIEHGRSPIAVGTFAEALGHTTEELTGLLIDAQR